MKTALIVFARVPQAGRVKTRLEPFLEPLACARLYRAFISDTVRMVDSLDADVRWYVEPHPDADGLALGRGSVNRQRGDGLGERMERAILETQAAGFHGTVLIGTDSPTLPPAVVGDALEAVKRPGAVLGPAADGGYYLIGLNGVETSFLGDVTYSRPDVFRETEARLLKLGVRPERLREWYDVDRPADLERLAAELRALPERAPSTAAFLAGLGIGRKGEVATR